MFLAPINQLGRADEIDDEAMEEISVRGSAYVVMTAETMMQERAITQECTERRDASRGGVDKSSPQSRMKAGDGKSKISACISSGEVSVETGVWCDVMPCSLN